MAGRVCLVTGANSGVGLETARGLAQAGATVVLAVRDLGRGEAARADIARTAPGARLEVLRLDVADLDSVRASAAEFLARHDRLHVLVNNAGIHTEERRSTPQGYESTFATNHLGHFLLTHLLLDALQRGAPSRVVNVASEAHRFGRIHFDDLMLANAGRPEGGAIFGAKAYNQSKLANILFTAALARRLDGTGVTANAVHPGSVRTGWARGRDSGLLRLVVGVAKPFLIAPEKGARTSLYAATAPGLEATTGRYFVRCREATPSRAARDVDAQERLWRESERLVGLNDPSR